MSSATASNSTAVDASYLALPLSTFQLPHPPSIDIYAQEEDGAKPHLLTSASKGLTDHNLIELRTHGCEQVLVKKAELSHLAAELKKSLQTLLTEKRIPSEERYALFQHAVVEDLERAFKRTCCEEFLSLVKKLAPQVISILHNSDCSLSRLFTLLRRDTNAGVQITNIVAYTVLLAQAKGCTDSKQLEKIAIGAMLHDLGKMKLPASLLNKQGRLSLEERELIERHTILGYEELCDRKEYEFGQLMMVYQHHERHDGTGYPVEITHEEIHPWASILAVADVFNAMTTCRADREARSLQQVLEHLAENASKHFDPQIVLCWISSFQQQ